MPLFNRSKARETEEYAPAAPAADVVAGKFLAVKIGPKKVLLTRFNGQVYAIDSLCPHAAADLSAGTLRGWQICCHEHDYCFDIRTGRIVWPEDEVYRLRRYETKEEGGRVFVRLNPLIP